MTNCPYCGAPIEESVYKCPYCDTQLNEPPRSATHSANFYRYKLIAGVKSQKLAELYMQEHDVYSEEAYAFVHLQREFLYKNLLNQGHKQLVLKLYQDDEDVDESTAKEYVENFKKEHNITGQFSIKALWFLLCVGACVFVGYFIGMIVSLNYREIYFTISLVFFAIVGIFLYKFIERRRF